ncbi:MAG TPA: molybdopterin cofactor-binding domain-containing protein [Gemmatimonadales bacterium]|nr:molybdopterin cofactor-binding domain-containing protein [Gemmatimonadales bacterium]
MQTLTPGSILGHAVRRREDPRLITGMGRYVDDLQPDQCLHVAFVRSTLAHATIRAVDVAAATAAHGVMAVFTAADLGLPARVGFQMVPEVFARPPLADGRVRFVGEPVALVVAESPQAAADAAQLVGLDLEPLEVVVDAEAARHAGSVLLFPAHGSNAAGHFAPQGDGDVLAGAEVTIRGRFVNQRLAPVPMEPEAILVVPEAGRLNIWATSQTPFGLRAEIASSLGLAESAIRVVVGDMGGGFGAKAGARPELIVVAAVARKLTRPVKWIETRSENLVAMTHGRGQVQHVELGATRDGRLVGLRARVVADIGAYPGIASFLPFLTGQMSSGVYAIPAIDYEAHCVVTNTTPLAAYRGAGRTATACSSGSGFLSTSR